VLDHPAGAPTVYTGRYQDARHHPDIVIVRISVGHPRFIRRPLPKLVEATPHGLLKVAGDEFEQQYRERLDSFGADRIAARLHDLTAEHGGPLVLCCYEDVAAGEACHRRMFADWWMRRAGEPIDELPPRT
jgi:hypothetical protein